MESNIKSLFKVAVARQLPEINRSSFDTIRIGIVVLINSTASLVSVRIISTGEMISNVSVPKGVTGVFVGNKVAVICPDVRNKSENYIIGVYGGKQYDGSTDWTPTLTNITIGNGVITGKQARIDKYVIANLNILFGSSTSVGGSVSISLPVTSVAMTGQAGTIPISTEAVLWDSSGTAYPAVVTWSNTTTAGVKCYNSAGTYTSIATLSSTVPFTWATGDEISLQIIYEVN